MRIRDTWLLFLSHLKLFHSVVSCDSGIFFFKPFSSLKKKERKKKKKTVSLTCGFTSGLRAVDTNPDDKSKWSFRLSGGLCCSYFTALCYPILSVYLLTFKFKKITSSDMITKEEMPGAQTQRGPGVVVFGDISFKSDIRPGMLSKVTGSIQSFKGNPTFPAFGAAT